MPVFTLSNYRALTAGELALSPLVLQLLQTAFPAKLIFFPFQWLNHAQEAVRYTEAHLAKKTRECPGELSMSITSDYLQFYTQDLEGKASNGSLQAMFIQGETSMSVFNLENVAKGLSSYTVRNVQMSEPESSCIYCMCMLLHVSLIYDDTSHHHQLKSLDFSTELSRPGGFKIDKMLLYRVATLEIWT